MGRTLPAPLLSPLLSQGPTPDRRAVLGGLAALGAGAALGLASPARASNQRITLAAAPARCLITGAIPTNVQAFNGQVPGPDLRIRQGETLRLRLENHLSEPLSLHWIGVRGPNALDGVAPLTQTAVAPNSAVDVDLTPPDSGTFIYRPIIPGKSGVLAGHGLSGLLIVQENTPPVFDFELALALNDWLLDDKGQIAPTPPDAAGALGRLGNVFTINNRNIAETYTVPRGARIRLRLAGLMVARLFNIRFQGARAWVAAVDSQPTDTFEPLKSTLPLKPGSRYDLFLEMPENSGAQAEITALIGGGVPIARFSVEDRAPRANRSAIAPLPPNTRLPAQIPLQAALRPNFVIDGGLRPGNPPTLLPWLINGEPGTLLKSKPIFSVGRDRPVVLSITNKTTIAQTIHLHGHAFRVLNALDDGWDPYWLDTVSVPEGRTTRIAFIADNPGRWMIGSALLDRLDRGLFGWFEVK
jgi:FtsP/CotA-like multicopper oxidase with cupredoxin domain